MTKTKEARRVGISRTEFKIPLVGDFLIPPVPEFLDDDELLGRVLELHEAAGRLRELVAEYNVAAAEKLEIKTVFAHNLRIKKLAVNLLDAAADCHEAAGPVCLAVRDWMKQHDADLMQQRFAAKAKLREHLAGQGFNVPVNGQSAGEWNSKLRNHASVQSLSAESEQAREAGRMHGTAASRHERSEIWCRAESAKRLRALANGSFEELVSREAAGR